VFKIRAMSVKKVDAGTQNVVSAAFMRESANPKTIIYALTPTSSRIHAVLHWRLLGALFAISLTVFVGCRSRSDRLAVSGDVTLNGAPLDQGSIRLTSTGAGKLFASGAMIQNGMFHVPQEKGLPPGTYRVEISSPDTAAPLVVYKGAPGEPPLPPTAPERIPPEYNSNSKQTIEVQIDGDNHFAFDIVRRGAR
jgi:hypothetical protein